jgi:hypothetical protein
VSTRARSASPAPARRQPVPSRARPLEETRPRRRARPQAAPRARTRTRTRAQTVRRWLWVPGIAVLLGGIVFLNAATLRLSTRSSLTMQRSSEAQSEIVNLNQALQQEDAQVRTAAARALKMKQENPQQMTFLRAKNPTP